MSQKEINRNEKTMILKMTRKKNEKGVKTVKVRPSCKIMLLAQEASMSNEKREVASNALNTFKCTLELCLYVVGYSEKLH